jgi:RimJ/RimL family protein N-acetyltransferase
VFFAESCEQRYIKVNAIHYRYLGFVVTGANNATESAVAVLAYTFGTLACDSIVVIIEPEHIASMRVTEKAGFQHTFFEYQENLHL